MFCGPTGQEVDLNYLPHAGLKRKDVLMVNTIACPPDTPGYKLDPGKRTHKELADCCADYQLYPLICNVGPKLLVPMGGFACRALGITDPLDLIHGMPTQTDWGMAFPMYHPALGMHEPKKMLHIRTDWRRLGLYLKGKLPLQFDSYAGHEDYQEITDVDQLADVDFLLPIALDTEWQRDGSPSCLTFSASPGTGRLVRSDRPDLLRAVNRCLSTGRAPRLLHSVPSDWPILERLGLQLEYRRVVDTLSLVFHLGNLPQGLKALALRELGMGMDDFEDVVKPHSTLRVLDYYRQAQELTWPKPTPFAYFDPETQEMKEKKPQGMNTKLKRFFTDLSKNPDKDVFGMWTENWTDSQAMIEAELGPWPGMCISHVPFAETLFYACRDVDALIRLYPLLLKWRAKVRKVTPELWRL